MLYFHERHFTSRQELSAFLAERNNAGVETTNLQLVRYTNGLLVVYQSPEKPEKVKPLPPKKRPVPVSDSPKGKAKE